jgi:hypothetical protein
MKAIEYEYYGDSTRWFIADVIDNTPPYGLEGRVRIRIHGLHSPSTADIRQADLPWAQLVIPTTEGGISGLGSTPRLETGAMVFGMFMDGKGSQTPIVIGSLPRTETPSRIQKRLEYETIAERKTPTEVFYQSTIDDLVLNLPVIADDNYGEINRNTTEFRKAEAVKFFLNAGYKLKQVIAIVATISVMSKMVSGVRKADNTIGLAGWSDIRLSELQTFSNDWKRFTVQLAFILYELNNTQRAANIKLLQTDTLDENNPNNCQLTFAKYYMKIKDKNLITSINTATRNLYYALV